MSTQKYNFKLGFLMLGILAFTYLIVIWGHQELMKLIDNMVVQILAILVGFIIAAVGILIASMGNLFSNLLLFSQV